MTRGQIDDGPFDGREIPDSITPDEIDSEAFISLAKLKERSSGIPPLEWLTASARDAVKVAVCFAGFDCKALVTRLARVPVRKSCERINAATVYRVMAEMTEEWDRAINARTAKETT